MVKNYHLMIIFHYLFRLLELFLVLIINQVIIKKRTTIHFIIIFNLNFKIEYVFLNLDPKKHYLYHKIFHLHHFVKIIQMTYKNYDSLFYYYLVFNSNQYTILFILVGNY